MFHVSVGFDFLFCLSAAKGSVFKVVTTVLNINVVAIFFYIRPIGKNRNNKKIFTF